MEWKTLTNKMWHEDIYLNGYGNNIESKLKGVDWKTWTSECCGGTKLVPQVRWSSDKLIINITSSIAKLSLVKVLTGNLADLMFKYDFNFPEGKTFWFREEKNVPISFKRCLRSNLNYNFLHLVTNNNVMFYSKHFSFLSYII